MLEAERQPSAAAGSGSVAYAVGSQLEGVVRPRSHLTHNLTPLDPRDLAVWYERNVETDYSPRSNHMRFLE